MPEIEFLPFESTSATLQGGGELAMHPTVGTAMSNDPEDVRRCCQCLSNWSRMQADQVWAATYAVRWLCSMGPRSDSSLPDSSQERLGILHVPSADLCALMQRHVNAGAEEAPGATSSHGQADAGAHGTHIGVSLFHRLVSIARESSTYDDAARLKELCVALEDIPARSSPDAKAENTFDVLEICACMLTNPCSDSIVGRVGAADQVPAPTESTEDSAFHGSVNGLSFGGFPGAPAPARVADESTSATPCPGPAVKLAAAVLASMFRLATRTLSGHGDPDRFALAGVQRLFTRASPLLERAPLGSGDARGQAMQSVADDFQPAWLLVLQSVIKACTALPETVELHCFEDLRKQFHEAVACTRRLPLLIMQKLRLAEPGSDSSTEREVVAKRVSNSLGAQYGLAQPAPRVQIYLASLDIASVFLTAEVRVMGKPNWECPQWPRDNYRKRERLSDVLADVWSACSKAKADTTLNRLPQSVRRYLSAYTAIAPSEVGVCPKVVNVLAQRAIMPTAFARRKDLCIGPDLNVQSTPDNTSASHAKANAGTGVVVVAVTLFDILTSHSDSAQSWQTSGPGSHLSDGKLVAKIFPLRSLLTNKGHSRSSNAHAAHSEAFAHLYMLSQARGIPLDDVRRELLGSRAETAEGDRHTAAEAPAAIPARGGAEAGGDGGAQRCSYMPPLMGVDVSPDAAACPEAKDLLKQLLHSEECLPGESVKAVWVFTPYFPGGTLAEMIQRVRSLADSGAPRLSPRHLKLFSPTSSGGLPAAAEFQLNFADFSLTCHDSPKEDTGGIPDEDVLRSIAVELNAVQRDLSESKNMFMPDGSQGMIAEKRRQLSQVITSIVDHGWPGQDQEAGDCSQAMAECRFTLSWKHRLQLMRDMMYGLAQTHAGSLRPELRGDYAFCHLDLSLNNSMLVSKSVVLIDWANACRRDGDAGEHTTSAACHLAKTMVADKQLRQSEDAAPIPTAANISGMSPGPADLDELEVSTDSLQRPSSTRTCQCSTHLGTILGAPELVPLTHGRSGGTSSVSLGSQPSLRAHSATTSGPIVHRGYPSGPIPEHQEVPDTAACTQLYMPPPARPNPAPAIAGHVHRDPPAVDPHGLVPVFRQGLPPPGSGTAASSAKTLFERHAALDVWACGIGFCEIIRLRRIWGGHCRSMAGGVYCPDGSTGGGELMAHLLPGEDQWWMLTPPLFSCGRDCDADWAGLWKDLRRLILKCMLVEEQHRWTALNVYTELNTICQKMQPGGPLSGLL